MNKTLSRQSCGEVSKITIFGKTKIYTIELTVPLIKSENLIYLKLQKNLFFKRKWNSQFNFIH